MELVSPKIEIEGYKQSLYNFYLKYDNGETVIFNSLSRCLCVLNSKETRDILEGRLPNDLLESLIEQSLIIPNDFNEVEIYAKRYEEVNYKSKILSLAIMPTLSCNCNCSYCFEKKSGARISLQTENDILNWIESILPRYKVLGIDWFGGEPLLMQASIKRMSEKLIGMCKEYGVTYTAAITTNGVLINDLKTIELLRKCLIRNVQITFDGNEKKHNLQKFLSNGKGTYKKLLENASLFCENNYDFKLRVRVNVSDDNYSSIAELLQDLMPLKKHITIFFRWVYENSASGWKSFSQREKGVEPYKGIYYLQRKAIELGFDVDDHYEKKQLQFSHCEADSSDFYTIDPLGNLYLCVHEYEPKYSIGDVCSGVRKDKLLECAEFHSSLVLSDEECLNCKLLPMCNGGCTRYRINHKKHLCIDEKNNMDLYIDMLYHRQKEQCV